MEIRNITKELKNKTTASSRRRPSKFQKLKPAINDYWQPIKTWTQISLAISQNEPTLSTITTALIAAAIVYSQILNTQKKHSLLILYGKLPQQDQQLINAIRIAQKTGNPTTTNIATQLQQLTKTSTPPEQLQHELEETANTGLITKTITSNNDEPTTWKTQLPPQNSTQMATSAEVNPPYMLSENNSRSKQDS
jgi:hypothetical protein